VRQVSDDIIAISDRPVPEVGTHFPWSALPEGLPTIIQYATVLVVPAADTAAAQEQLVELLQNDLRLARSGSTRVLWVLNEHANSAALEKVGLGRPIPVRDARRGRVRSFVHGLSFALETLHFGFADVPARANTLAVWDQKGAAGTVVGVASASGRWGLMPPPTDGLSAAAVRRLPVLSKVLGYAALAVIVLLAAVGLVGLADDASDEYQASVRALGSVRGLASLRLPNPSEELDERWLGAEERVATRIMAEEMPRLVEVADRLDSSLSPYELFRRGRARDHERNLLWLRLAYLTGDIGAARRILADVAADTTGSWYSRRGWMEEITGVIWMTALESLHELDFQKARTYTRIYLEEAAALTRGATGLYELAPERNRTLARLLSRELETDRIYSLCTQPDVNTTFGRLIGYRWRAGIPAGGLPELERRRAANREMHCGARPVAPVDYARALAALGAMRRGRDMSMDEDLEYTCRLFSLECRFLQIRRRVRDHQTQVIGQVADFSSECTYLADDLVGALVFEARARRGPFDAGTLRDRRLLPAWRCALVEDADYRGVIAEDLRELGLRVADLQPGGGV